ncbi:hypothetical protein O6H91_02G065400 [Diphasiastrum complanatum]|uniref:Uncharacterized protein n=1 Tax=Diphasiastrum complanatum TaxID=34168 RepID=A0ACC2EGX9_DIPCM|nr:hypothetical protein O6H91_02G065400 [Diphasiastrum complanatum]
MFGSCRKCNIEMVVPWKVRVKRAKHAGKLFPALGYAASEKVAKSNPAQNRDAPLRLHPENPKISISASSLKERRKNYVLVDVGKLNWLRAAVTGLDEKHEDIATYVNLLQECSNMKALSEGKRIHDHIVRLGLDKHPALVKRLVNMYGKCGDLEMARRIFEAWPNGEVVCWNAMISAYAKHGYSASALQLFEDMQQKGIEPNKITLVSILNACASAETLAMGKQIHSHILHKGFSSDVVLGTALINMYGKCGSLEEALKVFQELPDKNVVSWNTLITVYVQQDKAEEALAIYHDMGQKSVKADKVTFLSILNACTSPMALETGKAIEKHALDCGLEMDTAVATALFNMYCKCKSLEDAHRIFDKLCERNVISWSAIISAYAQDGQSRVALNLYKQMLQEGVKPDKVTFLSVLNACASPETLADGKEIHAAIVNVGLESDVVVGTALVNTYSKCGSLEDAQRVFDKMPDRNVVSWSAMIAAHAQFGKGETAIQFFEQMKQEGYEPNRITWVSVLDACAASASLERAKRFHEIVSDSGFESDVVVGTALVNLYAKCGSLDDAQLMFNRMRERNLISWNTLVTAYAQHGSGRVAWNLFGQMQMEGVPADEITFISVLSACNHAGLVEEAFHFFAAINVDDCISSVQEHYACMIDLVGRAGRLDEAENIMNTMPFPPNTVILMTLLSACRMHGDVERGRRISKLFLGLDPDNSAQCKVGSNIC